MSFDKSLLEVAMVSSWSQLPVELLHLILKRVNHLPDCFTFCKVCRSWRSVFLDRRSLSRPPPFILRPEDAGGCLCGLNGGRLLKYHPPMINILPSETIVGSSMGWLVIVNNHHGAAHLLNPISNERIMLPIYHDTIFHVAMSTSPRTGDCVFVLRTNGSYSTARFAWCRLSDSVWTNLLDVDLDLVSWWYCSSMFYNGQLYILGSNEFNIYAFDPRPRKIGSRSIANIKEKRYWLTMKLVHSGQDLLLIGWDKSICESNGNEYEMLHVFRQTEEPNNWVRVESLGDQTLLIGMVPGVSESFSTKDLMCSDYKPNSIYYLDLCNKLMMFSMSDGNNQMIRIPPTHPIYHHQIAWIVPRTWTNLGAINLCVENSRSVGRILAH